MKDPIGANLDRIQVVKGWMSSDGSLEERVYDVVVSDGRKIGRDGRANKAVGNTVDLGSATWSNTIGATEFITVWEDPAFDPASLLSTICAFWRSPRPAGRRVMPHTTAWTSCRGSATWSNAHR